MQLEQVYCVSSSSMMLERLVFVLFALCLGSVSSLIHHLTIEGDERELFKIEMEM